MFHDSAAAPKIPLSVVIVARNEERNLRECPESVAFAEEIVLVDDFSEDATAEIAAGRLVLFVIEAGKGTGTLPCVLSFVAVAVVEAPGTEAVLLAERLAVIVTARTEGTPGFFAIAIHETVATGTEGTFVLTIPAEGRAGLRGLVAVTGGIGEGARAEGLVRVLRSGRSTFRS